MKQFRLIMGLALLFGLGACEQFPPEYFTPPFTQGFTTSLVSTGPGFGNVTQHDWAVQVVNPEGEKVGIPPVMDGVRAASAIDRYQKGQVFKPEAIETTTGIIGGGSGGGGN